MQVKFYKYHGLGNDFIVLDLRGVPWRPDSKWIQHYSNRHLGIGFDQALILLPDSHCRIMNSDGSFAGHCGNGMRCIAHYLLKETNNTEIWIDANKVVLSRETENNYKVSMGKLNLIKNSEHIDTPWGSIKAGFWDIGNPHMTLLIENFNDIEVIGRWCQEHIDNINIGFAKIISHDCIELRVFERGAGLTKACASGACCAIKFLHDKSLVKSSVEVKFEYGSIQVNLLANNYVEQLGPASLVYVGFLNKN